MQISRSFFSILLGGSALFYSVAFAAVNDAGIHTKWSYIGNTGPTRWGSLAPGFAVCDSGKEQSPINIVKKTQPLAQSLTINYIPATMNLLNDGPTILVIGDTQTIFNDGHTLQVNFPANSKESITFNKVQYQLVQFHFHTPSETLWHAESYPMEIHFVHQGENGQVAVLAVLVKAGEANAELKNIIAHMPADQGVNHQIQGENVDPSALLPTTLDNYSFMGSLTTPPCTEGLQWIVLANAITASPAQILNIRTAIGNNARPVQPLHGRVINYSKAS